MSRRISIGGASKSGGQYVVAGLVTLLVLYGLIVVLGAVLGAESPTMTAPVLALLVVLWAGCTVGWVRLARTHAPEDPGSVWDAIPNRQYNGRYAEAGGLARDSWEKALAQLPGDDNEDR